MVDDTVSKQSKQNGEVAGSEILSKECCVIPVASPYYTQMKKSYYFPHDYHARHDPKLIKLRLITGCEGLGIYWCLIEMLYEENGYLSLEDIPLYAKELNTTEEKVIKVLDTPNLFTKKHQKFTSNTLLKRLKHINTKSSKARTSANKRWDANAMRTQCDGNAIKESKGKKSKVNKDPVVFPHLNNESFLKEWNTYVEHRREIRKPISSQTQERTLKTLHKYPIDEATKMLSQSIDNGWQGVFPLKSKKEDTGKMNPL